MILVGAAGAAAPDDHPPLDSALTWITLTSCGELAAPPDDHPPPEPPNERPSILIILTILGDDDAECDDPPELPPKLKKLA